MESCSCVYYDSYDYDGPKFCTITDPVARKEHKCSECGRSIKPGETYERVSGKWEGCIDTYKTCSDCLSARDSFFCAGYAYGGVWEMLSEHVADLRGEVSSSCIVSLTPRARERICELIEECWERFYDDDE